MNLESYAKNQFLNIRASIERREKFFNYNIMRMEANNPDGLLNDVIAESKPLHDLLVENLKARSYTSGAGKGSTFSVKMIMKEFIDTANDIEALVRVKFDKDSAEYLKAFPRGLTEFHNINQGGFCP